MLHTTFIQWRVHFLLTIIKIRAIIPLYRSPRTQIKINQYRKKNPKKKLTFKVNFLNNAVRVMPQCANQHQSIQLYRCINTKNPPTHAHENCFNFMSDWWTLHDFDGGLALLQILVYSLQDVFQDQPPLYVRVVYQDGRKRICGRESRHPGGLFIVAILHCIEYTRSLFDWAGVVWSDEFVRHCFDMFRENFKYQVWSSFVKMSWNF